MSKEKDTKIQLLEAQIEELNIEIERLKLQVPSTNVEEQLLLREINHIDKLSLNGGLNMEETKQLKLLIDSLVSIRRVEKGLPADKGTKVKTEDVAKLLQIVRDGNE